LCQVCARRRGWRVLDCGRSVVGHQGFLAADHVWSVMAGPLLVAVEDDRDRLGLVLQELVSGMGGIFGFRERRGPTCSRRPTRGIWTYGAAAV
jgi:hypothetical protein